MIPLIKPGSAVQTNETTSHSLYGRYRLYSPQYYLLGLVLVFAVLYLMTFKVFDYSSREGLPGSFVNRFHIAAAFAFIGAAAAVGLQQRPINFIRQLSARTFPYDILVLALLIPVAYVTVFLPFESIVLYTISFNLILFAGIIGLIFLGFSKGNPHFVNIALLFFALDVFTRYFDFGWELLPRSLFFIIGGLLLLGTGVVLERLRRRILQRMRAVEVEDEAAV